MAEQRIPFRSLDINCDAAHMTDRGLRWLQSRKSDQRWFLWLHYYDPHWPYLAPEEELTEEEQYLAWSDQNLLREEVIPRNGHFDAPPDVRARWTSKYRRALASADREIGRLLDGIRARDDWGNTMVVLTGDHGEEFQEHGTWFHAWNRLHREGINVPLLIRAPGLKGSTFTRLVSNIDIAPTILDYTGAVQQAGAAPMMGSSLRSILEGEELPERPIYSEMLGFIGGGNHPVGPSYGLTIRDQEWTYIYNRDYPHDSQLYMTAKDPDERVNRREDEPVIFRQFERLRLAHVSRGLVKIMQKLDTDDTPLDPLVREQMVALGYLAE